ncbi:ABC transporter permease [Hydrogenimonas thermophila]|uniref:ABC transporter permease n=1 Tax=Hydrogenimonas thermophila TaxID=223786 RepID=UPI0029371725|nr:ABC transporter permease [Hydrogenimonas thermophila]WOE69188.1 ABC transporter permease [Hydrogenimonas thermophila]WOE71698.1 ABC transporter permease [Hydrogenimonas thermophila]
MLNIAIKMLWGDRTKFFGLLFGISFTAFLVTFALSFFAGFMTNSFALISENPTADVWVMDPAVQSTEMTINMPESVLSQVKSIDGVNYATALAIGDISVRFPNGRFQTFQMIGVDDATLTGAPKPPFGDVETLLHIPDAVIVASGGTEGKLQTPIYKRDQWAYDGAHLSVPMRSLKAGDELLINDKRVFVAGVSKTIPRFPPRPLIYTTFSTFKKILPSESRYITFVLVSAKPGVSPKKLAQRISTITGFSARTSDDFKKDTIKWYLINSEDVGDMSAMLILAMTVGFGFTGIMLYMFTYENLQQYAVLKAIGTSDKTLLSMIFAQASVTAFIGAGIGIGVCALVGELIVGFEINYPFRLMWFAPLVGVVGVMIISLTAALISMRPVLQLDPVRVFSGK